MFLLVDLYSTGVCDEDPGSCVARIFLAIYRYQQYDISVSLVASITIYRIVVKGGKERRVSIGFLDLARVPQYTSKRKEKSAFRGRQCIRGVGLEGIILSLLSISLWNVRRIL